MRVLHVTHSLTGATGVQTYLLTVADAMQRAGHDVWITADELGDAADHAERLGLRVLRGPPDQPDELDVAIVHSAIASHETALTRPGLAQVFIAHGSVFDNYVPPQAAGQVSAVVTLFETTRLRIETTALPIPCHALVQPVDRMRFRDRAPIRTTPRRVLVLSNYLEGERLERLRDACARAGIEMRHVGATGEGTTMRPEDAINEADIVVGKGRAIVEAMACGRAAYVYDMWGGDGWVTPESYDRIAARGFGGVALPGDRDAGRIADDLAAYSPALGGWGAETVLQKHSLEEHVRSLLEIARAATGANTSNEDFSSRRELARLARQSWRHEGQAHVLSEQLKQQSLRVTELEDELRTMRESRSWRITAPLRRLRRRNR